MKRTGIDKICTYLEEKKLSVEEVIRIAFYAGNLEGNKEIIVADEEAEMSLVADVSEDVIRASHNQHMLTRKVTLDTGTTGRFKLPELLPMKGEKI